MNEQKRFLTIATVLLSGLCSCSLSQALAAGPQAVSQTIPQAEIHEGSRTVSSFETAFQIIAEASKVTIIAEGVPYRSTLAEKERGELIHALDAESEASIDRKIAIIALAYDYEAERYDAHTILLRKRYSDINDLPCVTYDEVLNSYRQILHLTSHYALPIPQGSTYSLAEQLYRSFTLEQAIQARDGIRVEELNANQRDLARRDVGDSGMGSMAMGLQYCIDHLAGLQDSRSEFAYLQANGITAFGYREPFWHPRHMQDFPVNEHFHVFACESVQLDPVMMPVRLAYYPPSVNTPRVIAEKEARLGSDLTIPADVDRRFAAGGMLAQKLSCTTTLGALSQAIVRDSLQTPNTSSVALKISVEPGIADKPVSIFGQRFATADNLVRSVSALYKLQLLVPHKDDYALILPLERGLTQPTEFAAEVTRLIPDPLQRVFKQRQQVVLDPSRRPDSGAKTPPHNRFDPEAHEARPLAETYDRSYYPAARRLLVLAMPAVPTPDSPPVPFSQMPPEVLRLIAIMVYSGYYREIEFLAQIQLPHFVADPANLVVKLTRTESVVEVIFHEEYGYRDSAGVFHGERESANSRTKDKTDLVPVE